MQEFEGKRIKRERKIEKRERKIKRGKKQGKTEKEREKKERKLGKKERDNFQMMPPFLRWIFIIFDFFHSNQPWWLGSLGRQLSHSVDCCVLADGGLNPTCGCFIWFVAVIIN